MKPTLRQLEYFIAVAETGSFVDAAQACAVSQPSLSQQVQDMEAVLGQELFERSRSGARLTPMGEQALPMARDIILRAKALKYLAQGDEQELVGTIKLGVLSSVGPYLLPYAAKQLHSDYPDLRLQVVEGRISRLRDMLHEGGLDAIISTAQTDPRFAMRSLFTENAYICSAIDDPLGSSRAPVALSELKGRELLSLGPTHQFSELVRSVAEKSGALMNAQYEGSSLDAIRQMSLMGDTVSVLPSLYCLSEAKRDSDLFIRRIDDAQARREICLFWRKSSPLSGRYEKLGLALEQTGARLLKEMEEVGVG